MRTSLAVPLFALFAAAGCDPVGEVRFVVVDARGAPVAGANVDIACPGYPTPSFERSGPDGVVSFTHIPDINPACTFAIEKPGFVPKTISRADAGYHQGIDPKTPPVKVELADAPPSSPSAAPTAAPQAPSAAPSAPASPR